MEFEWDTVKNRKNIEKHGIDFSDAALVFEAPMLVYEDIRENYGEKRFSSIGVVEGVEIFVSYTLRGERVRIISARKARKDERQKYRSIHASKSS